MKTWRVKTRLGDRIFLENSRAEIVGALLVFILMNNLSHANEVFDGIEFTKKNSIKGSPSDFDFIITYFNFYIQNKFNWVTTGDNIYPKVAEYPSIQEFN